MSSVSAGETHQGCGRGRHQWASLPPDRHTRFVKGCCNCFARVIRAVNGDEQFYYLPTVLETIERLKIAASGGDPCIDPATGILMSRYEAKKALDALDDRLPREHPNAASTSGREFSYPEINGRIIDDRRLTDPYPIIDFVDLDDVVYDMTLTGPSRPTSSRPGSSRPGEQTTLRRITSMEAMQLILDEIKLSPDPFAAAGVWLTRFTNGVAEITREEE